MSDDLDHVLVVDDDQRLRELLARYLASVGFRVTTAADAEEAARVMVGLAFDAIVLDVMMPGESGLEMTQRLRDQGEETPILLLTAMGDAADRIAGLEAGADDYLPKPFEPRELELRVRAITRRRLEEAPAAAQEIRLGSCAFEVSTATLTRDGAPVRLTETEATILQALAQAGGEPVAREALMGSSDDDANPRAVDVQITRLRRKIEPDPKAPHYLRTVRGAGYALTPDREGLAR